MKKSQTFHSIRRDAPTTLRRVLLLARSFARIALLASLLLVAPVENLSARDVRAEVEKHNASIQETERERKYKAMRLTPFTYGTRRSYRQGQS
jgi:hypothetical protein